MDRAALAPTRVTPSKSKGLGNPLLTQSETSFSKREWEPQGEREKSCHLSRSIEHPPENASEEQTLKSEM